MLKIAYELERGEKEQELWVEKSSDCIAPAGSRANNLRRKEEELLSMHFDQWGGK